MCVICVEFLRGQKREFDFKELELQKVVSCDVGAENLTMVFPEDHSTVSRAINVTIAIIIDLTQIQWDLGSSTSYKDHCGLSVLTFFKSYEYDCISCECMHVNSHVMYEDSISWHSLLSLSSCMFAASSFMVGFGSSQSSVSCWGVSDSW